MFTSMVHFCPIASLAPFYRYSKIICIFADDGVRPITKVFSYFIN